MARTVTGYARFALFCAGLLAARGFGLDGTVLLTTAPGAVILYDMATGDTLWLAPAGAHPRGCFSPDGREVAVRMGDGRIRILRVDGAGYRDLLTDAGGVRAPANPWLYWLPSGHIYWAGGYGAGWHMWQGPFDRVYRVDASTGLVDTVYRDTALSVTMSITADGAAGYRHRRWDLTGADTMVHYIGNCGAAMSMDGHEIGSTKPYHRSVHFYSRDTLESCCPSVPYTRCWGGGCVADTFGCANDCQRRAFVDTVALPPEVWEERWATPPHAGDEWLVALHGFGGSEGAYLFNRETGEYWHFDTASFGGVVINPCDFWPGALPDMSGPAIALDRTAAVYSGDTLDTLVVSNAGHGTLSTVSCATSSAWLTASALGTGDTQHVQLSVHAGALAPGLHVDTLVVSGGGADNTALCVVTLALGGVLVAPSYLVALQMANSQGTSLSWIDNTTDEEGFVVERRSEAGSWEPVASPGAGQTQFEDQSLVVSGFYTYRVRAFRGMDSSGYSNEATAPFVSATAIIITSPAVGDTWPAGGTAVVAWTAGAGVGVLGIEVSLDGGETFRSVLDSGSVPPEQGTQTIAVPDSAGTDVYVAVYEYTNPQGARALLGPVVISVDSRVRWPRDPAFARTVHLQAGAQRVPLFLPTLDAFTVSLYSASGRLLARRRLSSSEAARVTDIRMPLAAPRGVLVCVVECAGVSRSYRFCRRQ